MGVRRIAVGLVVMMALATVARAKTVTVGEADKPTDVFLNLGDTLVVELSSGDVNGFGWVLHLPKGSGLTLLKGGAAPAAGGNKGGARVPFRVNTGAGGD